MRKRAYSACLVPTLLVTFAALIGRQKSSVASPNPPLLLTVQIPLPGVQGRFDHLTFDPGESNRIFISALGNDSVEVINLVRQKLIHTISGIPEPQGITYAPSLNKLFVASRYGQLYIYDGATYKLIGKIDYHADVDNLRYEDSLKRVYVAYGDGNKAAIGMVNATTNQRLEEEYKTGAHPESFQLEKTGSKIFVNLPDLKQVAVIDRDTKKIERWSVDVTGNFPMALDEVDHRLFVVSRTPPRLLVLDTNSGEVIAKVPCVGSADDLYYDASLKRLYVPGGQGFIDVFQQQDSNHYQRIARIPTVVGARTAGFATTGKKAVEGLYIAVPAGPGREASVWVYTPEE